MILVVGTSGLVAGEVRRLLEQQGEKVRGTTSNKAKASEQEVYVNLQTGEGLHQAFEGVERAFFLSPGGIADQYAMVSPLIQEAKRRGLEKVVLMTAMGANADESAPFRRAEVELENSGLTYNIIRPNWFMDNFTTFWLGGIKAGVLELPAGDAMTTFIDSRDIAAVAARLITDDSFKNRDFDLSGPEALTHAQIASQISELTDRSVRYQNGAPEALKSSLLAMGANEPYADFLNLIMSFLKAGYNTRLTTAVKDITGREPRTFAQFVIDHQAAF